MCSPFRAKTLCILVNFVVKTNNGGHGVIALPLSVFFVFFTPLRKIRLICYNISRCQFQILVKRGDLPQPIRLGCGQRWSIRVLEEFESEQINRQMEKLENGNVWLSVRRSGVVYHRRNNLIIKDLRKQNPSPSGCKPDKDFL